MDTVLRDHFPGEARNSRVDPVSVPKFEVKVKKVLFTHRDFKAKFQNGNIYGLSNVRRRGDCSAPGWQGANVTIGCYISLDGVRVSYQVTAKGHNLRGTKKEFSADFHVENTNAFVEITSLSRKYEFINFLFSRDRVPR